MLFFLYNDSQQEENSRNSAIRNVQELASTARAMAAFARTALAACAKSAFAEELACELEA